MKRSDFYFDLPQELIAQSALPRGDSRMLVLDPAVDPPHIEHRVVRDFVSFIRPDDVIVFNDTRVFPARLHAEPIGNMTRGIEILLVKRVAPDVWECWVKPMRRMRVGATLRFSPHLSAEVVALNEDSASLRFLTAERFDEDAFWSEVERLGEMPLPPYIRRERQTAEDRAAYQTVYARERGAVAAPTAGLHFSDAMLEELKQRAEVLFVTLHVGIGTFKAVKVDDVSDHRMESERYELTESVAERLNAARAERRRIVAIGTTTVRTLESAIRVGDGRFVAGRSETDIFITPGFEFRAVDALLTNFHLPESTLLMLVSAFVGRETALAAYREAVEQRYRFYSFGDCMLVPRRSPRN